MRPADLPRPRRYPAFAEIGHDITLPVVGRVVLPHVTYTTELSITNHRDVVQRVAIDFVGIETSRKFDGVIALEPRGSSLPASSALLRIRAIDDGDNPDPNGRIDATAYIVAVRGPFGLYGTSRQEINATPSEEYTAKEALFHGVRHDLPVYTNVGITNLDPVEPVTFYVQFAYLDPIEVTVPPQTLVQVRIPGIGNAGRWVRVYPAWAINGEDRAIPWVAYASSVDGQTGDAWSGIRAPSKRELTK